MAIKIEKNGVVEEFDFDFDYLYKLEEADPNFDLSKVMTKLAEGSIRISTYNMLTMLIGVPYQEFLAKGYDIKDVISITNQYIGELGFIVEQDTTTEVVSDN